MSPNRAVPRTRRSSPIRSGEWGCEQLRSLSDELLIREVAQGDQDAFLVLFDRYWRQVFRLACSVIRDQAEAEDVAQALFVEVHTSLLGFDEKKGSFRTLILRYTYTRSIDHRRWLESRRFYNNVYFGSVDPSQFVQYSESVFGLSAEEATQLVRQSMKNLDEKQRLTIDAYFFRGLSPDEIASELDDSCGNVRHHLYRGLEKMRIFIMASKETTHTGQVLKGITNARLWLKARKGLASDAPVVRSREV
jgi:RNA polymerase sigma-70 factor, ECF subfamily